MNLKRLERAGLPCPIPLQFKKHVLLMSLIQDECGNCAPKLKDYIWASEEEKFTIFEQVKDIMIKMFNECKLVHADLSEFNLLFTTGKIYVIDLAQSVDLSHPRSLIFLHRDIENILNFFSKNATEGLPTAHQLFKDITQIEFDHQKDLLAEIESFNEQNHFTNLAQFRKRAGDYGNIF
jgi:serine/threonine-protein kinase RIO1